MQALQVSKLQAHPQNEYFFDEMSGQKWEEFKESIKTSGVIEPIVVTQDLIIVSGHQRVRACRELGIVTILGEVRHYDNHDGRCAEDWVIKDLIETNVRQRGNIGGSELKAVHRVDELRRIYKVDGGGKHKSCDNVTTSGEPVTAEEACKAAGIDYASYRQFKSLSDLIPDWQELLDSGNVSASVASRIIGKLSEDEQEQLYNALPVKERITAKLTDKYLCQIRQQQVEMEQKEKQWQGTNASLANRLNLIVAKNNELDDRITELKQKGDPELVAKIDKLQEDCRRVYENYQKANSENYNLKCKLQDSQQKINEANGYIQELLEQTEALEDNALTSEQMRELTNLRAENKRLERELAQQEPTPLAEPVMPSYTMGGLKKFLCTTKSELETYLNSKTLNLNAEAGDNDYIKEMIGELVPLALHVKDKVCTLVA